MLQYDLPAKLWRVTTTYERIKIKLKSIITLEGWGRHFISYETLEHLEVCSRTKQAIHTYTQDGIYSLAAWGQSGIFSAHPPVVEQLAVSPGELILIPSCSRLQHQPHGHLALSLKTRSDRQWCLVPRQVSKGKNVQKTIRQTKCAEDD
jgi:hypothetical protein